MKLNFRCKVGCLFVLLLVAGMHCTYAQNDIKRQQSGFPGNNYCYSSMNAKDITTDPYEADMFTVMQIPSENSTGHNQQCRPSDKSSKPGDHHTGPVVTEHKSGSPILLERGAILGKCVYLNRSTKDTITVFVDIYSRGALMMPVGLKYSGEQN